MYDFNDTIRGTPSASYGIGLTFGDKNLTSELNNDDGSFYVANTAGRDALDFSHETADVRGRHGEYFYGQKYQVREIEVQVVLSGNDNQKMRRQYERLNALLYSEEPQMLVFDDDPDRYFMAVFSKVKKPELENANNTVLKLHFLCHDPFKYSNLAISDNYKNYLIGAETAKALSVDTSTSSVNYKVFELYAFGKTLANAGFSEGNLVTLSFDIDTSLTSGTYRVEFYGMNGYLKIFGTSTEKVLKKGSFTHTTTLTAKELSAVRINIRIDNAKGQVTIKNAQFVRGDTVRKFSKIGEVSVEYQGDFPSYPAISVTLDTDEPEELVLLHIESGKYIRLKIPYVDNREVVVDNEARTILLDGENGLAHFDMVNSRFFALEKGTNTIKANGGTITEIHYREVFA